jgi:hypothetical protein
LTAATPKNDAIPFTAWPSIARLNRPITVTEKIDGTNACVGIVETPGVNAILEGATWVPKIFGDGGYLVYAQSRTRVITPQADNFGFAAWVWENAKDLAGSLGEGIHHGEWWGSGIQRGYDKPKGYRYFSLFNTQRWGDLLFTSPPALRVVPVLYEGMYNEGAIQTCLDELRALGSAASFGFDKPEGIVIYHHHARTMFKVTLENDEVPKSVAERRQSTRA